jgi:MoaA/NifB/PqqE/SkfB family radical SAM enzyme
MIRLLRKTGVYERVRDAYHALQPPRYPGTRVTLRRLLNYHVNRYQHARGHTKLVGYPLVLCLEPINACNLKCPYCFTGAGEIGRKRSTMPMPLYRKIMDELGDYALRVEFFNWGEPLLNKNVYEMIRVAARKELSTAVSTNFSVPFDRARAEEMVSCGLTQLGVSIDGAQQTSYGRYRVGGDLDTVFENVRLVNEAKRRLGTRTPQLVWEFHVFEWNKDEVEPARSVAKKLGMDVAVSKGWVAGPEWDPASEFEFPPGLAPAGERCSYLWTEGLINNDGRVAPCAGSFFPEDDYGSVMDATFKDVWNNSKFQKARGLFRSQSAVGGGSSLICYSCPYTIVWENYQRHLARGLPKSSFEPVYTTNDWFNFFFNRRPGQSDADETPRVAHLGSAEPRPCPGLGQPPRRPPRGPSA